VRAPALTTATWKNQLRERKSVNFKRKAKTTKHKEGGVSSDEEKVREEEGEGT